MMGKRTRIVTSSLFLFFSLSVQTAFTQMDSVSVSIYEEGEVTSPLDSTQTIPLLKLSLYVADYDFFGELFVEVLEKTSQHPIYRVKYDLARLETEAASFTDNQFILDFIPFMNEVDYTIHVRVKDYLLNPELFSTFEFIH
ncbi:hypothetical protein GCM10009118_00970 [Wandonia haliotis]|uniref:Uncharacterized protein n=1 Tax=Wandonia haliotis TaxID=574963 RepID=A0ABN1MKD3_9FLAO